MRGPLGRILGNEGRCGLILTDADELRETLRVALRERDEARAELLSIAQQLELEREAGAQLRAELGERMRETAEAQREACAAYMDRERWYTSRAALSAPLVTDTKANGGTP